MQHNAKLLKLHIYLVDFRMYGELLGCLACMQISHLPLQSYF